MNRRQPDRRGVAAVELAFVTMLFIAPLLIGLWEMGRFVEVQQILGNSCRDGARLASQGYTVNLTGAPTQIMTSSGTTNVQGAIYQYLIAAGLTDLTSSDVVVTLTFLDLKADGSTATEPYQGEKGMRFTVTATIPWSKVRWVNLGLINPISVTYTASWQMLVDDKFTVNDTIPVW